MFEIPHITAEESGFKERIICNKSKPEGKPKSS
jgi:hypothetical protein